MGSARKASPEKSTEEKKSAAREETVEDKGTRGKKVRATKKKTAEDKASEDKKSGKRRNTAEDKTTEDKKGRSPRKAESHCEPLFSTKTEESFEFDDLDVRTLEQDALDTDEKFNTFAEYSARDAEGEKTKRAKRLELKKRLIRVIRQLTKKQFVGNHYPFNYNDITRSLRILKSMLIHEPAVATCKAPAVIVGDLHGQFSDLLRIFDSFAEKGLPGYYTSRYVFLGDYVDRGKQSLEVLMLCIWLKILYPAQFVLLRGNHEFRAINKTYGFYAEIKKRFPGIHSDMLFEQFNDLFMYFPLCCFVAGNILCMHGGISSKMKTRADLLKLRKPLRDAKDDPIACDLMWADPMIGLKGEIPNKVRGVSVHFGEDQLAATMRALGVKLVVRGHQMMHNGFGFFAGHKLCTVFSASAYYPTQPNKGAVMFVTKEGRIGFKTFAPAAKKESTVEGTHEKSHDEMNEADMGHAVFTPEPEAKKPATGEKE